MIGGVGHGRRVPDDGHGELGTVGDLLEEGVDLRRIPLEIAARLVTGSDSNDTGFVGAFLRRSKLAHPKPLWAGDRKLT